MCSQRHSISQGKLLSSSVSSVQPVGKHTKQTDINKKYSPPTESHKATFSKSSAPPPCAN